MDAGDDCSTDCSEMSTVDTSRVTTQIAQVSGQDSDDLSQRLRTFERWSNAKDKVQLAEAGFTYTGIADKVECKVCKIRLYNWQQEEDPLQAHKRYAPDCDFMKKNFPNIKAPIKPKVPVQVRYPHYSDYQARLRSFNMWPLKTVPHCPEYMARAGFFYIGSADRARCFHCGVTLRDWDTDDYPPSAHKQWSDTCPFIQQLDVSEFRQEIEEAQRRERLRVAFNKSVFVDIGERRRAGNAVVTTDCAGIATDGAPSARAPSAERQVGVSQKKDDFDSNPAVLACIEMGARKEDIKKVIDERRRQGLEDFPNASSILMAVEDL